jgi:glycerophosphoryl diester phosphodiesterase
VILIAHRGASAVAPENTRSAIRAAARAGAHMVELDVQMTRDGRLVVFHDERLERTTNGTGRFRDARYRELAQLDLGSWFHPRFAGERILLVSEAIRCIPQRMGMNLELKRSRHQGVLLRRLRQLLTRHRVGHRVLLSSFDQRLLRAMNPSTYPLALICHQHAERSLRRAIRLGCVSWHPFHRLVTPRRVAQAHARGLRVYAWTVDSLPRARRLLKWGVDGLFTNDPAKLRRLR